jgi:predicted dehydrogenase
MDIMQWLIGKNCTRVQSFGGTYYFKPENAPEGAPERCVDGCPHADTCYYNARKIYMEDYRERSFACSAAGTAQRPTDEQLENALRNTDYGRCVFRMDNDVVDHQVVNLEFEGGVTASFSMCAFNKGQRRIRIMGTKGELSGEMKDVIRFYDFATSETREIALSDVVTNDTIDGGHGGGDQGIIRALCDRLNGEEGNIAICSIEDTCRNHLIAYAAEESRIEGTVVDMKKFEDRFGGLI